MGKGKNWDLSRAENTRDIKDPYSPFDLDAIYNNFLGDIKEIKGLSETAEGMFSDGTEGSGQVEERKTKKQKKQEKHLDHIRRAQVVFLVSALDYYMHGLIKYGLYQMYKGHWDQTNDYGNLRINLKFVLAALDTGDSSDKWFVDNIGETFGKTPMGSFNAMEKHLGLLGINIEDVADNMFPEFVETAEKNTLVEFKRCLQALYKRRNIIAHQASKSPDTAEVEQVSVISVENFIENVEKIVKAIDTEAREKVKKEVHSN